MKPNPGLWRADLHLRPGRGEGASTPPSVPVLYTASLVVTLQGLTGEKTGVQRGVSNLPKVTPPGGGSFPDAGSGGRLPPCGWPPLTVLAGNRPERLSVAPMVTQLRRGSPGPHREPGSPRATPPHAGPLLPPQPDAQGAREATALRVRLKRPDVQELPCGGSRKSARGYSVDALGTSIVSMTTAPLRTAPGTICRKVSERVIRDMTETRLEARLGAQPSPSPSPSGLSQPRFGERAKG